jgi:N-acetylglucosaminyl-diphospho-decaprenol L-rhamnosyltransferase
MKDILVSVVIVSWNSCRVLPACLESLLAASKRLEGDVETIVVDNASSDESVATILREFPFVRVVQNGANLGFAAACNRGIRESSGRYILLLNPDTELSEAFLERLLHFLEAEPQAAAAGPRVIGKDHQLQVSCYPLPTLGRELWRLCRLDRFYPVAVYPIEGWSMAEPHPVEALQGACILIRRSALDETGHLDERFFMYSEEVDLCRRLLQLGWKNYWVPGSMIRHLGAGSTDRVPVSMFLQLYKSKIQYFRKHLGTAGAITYKILLALIAFPRLMLPYLAAALAPARSAGWKVTADNYRSLLRKLPAL